MIDIEINGENILDILDLELMEKSIQPPTKKIVKQTVPFMNGSLDFSSLGGEITYEDRKVTCKFAFGTKNSKLLHARYTRLLDKLLTTNDLTITFSEIYGYYFKGRVENTPSFEELMTFGTLTIEFVCYPFKVSVINEGHDNWDLFNFELDRKQDVKFSVVGSTVVTLYNLSSCKVNPTVSCTAAMQVTLNGTTFNFSPTVSSDRKFLFSKGVNELTISGTGDIEFIWRKEVL